MMELMFKRVGQGESKTIHNANKQQIKKERKNNKVLENCASCVILTFYLIKKKFGT